MFHTGFARLLRKKYFRRNNKWEAIINPLGISTSLFLYNWYLFMLPRIIIMNGDCRLYLKMFLTRELYLVFYYAVYLSTLSPLTLPILSLSLFLSLSISLSHALSLVSCTLRGTYSRSNTTRLAIQTMPPRNA